MFMLLNRLELLAGRVSTHVERTMVVPRPSQQESLLKVRELWPQLRRHEDDKHFHRHRDFPLRTGPGQR